MYQNLQKKKKEKIKFRQNRYTKKNNHMSSEKKAKKYWELRLT